MIFMKKKKKVTETASGAVNGQIYNMSSKDISAYASFFENNGLEELIIEEKGTKVIFRKSAPRALAAVPAAPALPAEAVAAAPAAAAPTEAAPAADDEGMEKVLSPLNGTFYSKPSPESPDFVSAGAAISSGSVLCIVEAMKIFNEIKSEVSGKVVKILTKNGDTVQEGQPLFLIDPS